jgi:hypothetical protein
MADKHAHLAACPARAADKTQAEDHPGRAALSGEGTGRRSLRYLLESSTTGGPWTETPAKRATTRSVVWPGTT